jgi:N-acetylmuramic acid 6-phosphate etherase
MDRIFNELKDIITEQRNPDTMDIDSKSIEEILITMNSEDRKVASIVAGEIPHIAKGVELIVQSLKRGGKLIYIGAGT